MKTKIWRWTLHRAAVDKLAWLKPFSNRKGLKRWLIISEDDPICHAQIFPYFFYHIDFLHKYDIEIRELPLRYFKNGKHPYNCPVDAVSFQTWFDLSDTDLENLTLKVKENWPKAKLAYFDWFAPVDLRYANILDKFVDVYLKKQMLKDFGQYEYSTFGDTNLTNYYSQRYHLDLPITRYDIPKGFEDKIILGPSFALADYMIKNFIGEFPAQDHRYLDIHARITVEGTEWYTLMRKEALEKVATLDARYKTAFSGRVKKAEYFRELYNAKLCFSPFGYGEVCWRDFEAMYAGSLLLKPDMSHLICYPNVFLPYETYVPLAWDLSDFKEKVDYYLNDFSERSRITRNAFELFHDYFQSHQFVEDCKPFLDRLGML